jgi:hydrogenase maturation protease
MRGDDGIGARLIKELEREGVPPGVELIDGGMLGLHLLTLVEDYGHVIIVDAASMEREPAEIVRFTPDEAVWSLEAEAFSVHHAGLAEALALAQALGRGLPLIVVFGVQPVEIGWREGLSPQVEAALPTLIDRVLAELNRASAPAPSANTRFDP